MKIITVIPFKKGPFSDNLTYFSSLDIKPGSIVNVELRNKKTLGLVTSANEASDLKGELKRASFNLKKITEVKDQSIFRPEFFNAAKKTARYFATGENETIATLIPGVIKENYDLISKTFKQKNLENKSNNIRSEKLLLQENPEDRIAYLKTLIRGSFAEKKSVFVVLPNEQDIKTWHEILSKGIEQFSIMLFNGLPSKKIIEEIKKVLTETHPVLILGSAQFLALPRADIKTIIVEHESGNFKTLSKPHIDLRIFAEVYALEIGARFILSDTLLRYESLARKEEGYALARPINWRHKLGAPFEIIDSKKKQNDKWKLFQPESIYKIEHALERGKNVFIFSLRKGLATETICRDCSQTLLCEVCSAPLVLYKTRNEENRIFMCNRCNKTKDPEIKCPYCASWNLYPLGIGTDTVFEEAKKIFPKTKILKLDKEEAKNKTGAKKIIDEFEKNKDKNHTRGSILIGTELALLYMQQKVNLSVIASFDSLWSIPNFRMSEKILNLLLNIMSKTEQALIVQTKNVNEDVLLALKQGNLSEFIKNELWDRKEMGYPPYKRFIKITHIGNKTETNEARNLIPAIFEDFSPLIFRGFAPKSKEKFVTNILIKKDIEEWSLPELTQGTQIDEKLLKKLNLLPSTYSIDVDPESLL